MAIQPLPIRPQVEPSLLAEGDEPAVGLGDAVGSGVRGSGPRRASSRESSRSGAIGSWRSPWVTRLGGGGGDRGEGRDELLDRHDRAADVERLGPLEGAGQGDGGTCAATSPTYCRSWRPP